MGNCDTTLFLGGMEKPTLKEILELLGKETIDSVSQAENRCDQVPYNLKQAILFDTGCVMRAAGSSIWIYHLRGTTYGVTRYGKVVYGKTRYGCTMSGNCRINIDKRINTELNNLIR